MKRVLDVLARAPEAISCRLSPEDLVERADAWRTVRGGLESIDQNRFEGGFSIVLRGDEARLDEVSRLVAAERQCCGWARWDFEREPALATLTVSGDEELIAPLASAFLRAND